MREAYSIALVQVRMNGADFGHIPAKSISSRLANSLLRFVHEFGHDAHLLSERALKSLRRNSELPLSPSRSTKT